MEQEVEYIFGIPKFSKKASLDNTRELLERLGNPEVGMKVIHVAGTNGKGSVCAYLDHMLRANGYSTGVFTSPHLAVINERIRVHGDLVSDLEFEEVFAQVKKISLEMMEEGYVHPSFFEFLFAMAMVVFQKHGVDYVVLETGLGGRLDATNVIQVPVATVITSISLDHTDILGDTFYQIAMEKAGIIKAGVPLVYWDGHPEATKAILERAKEMGIVAISVQKDQIGHIVKKDKYIDFSIHNRYYCNEVFSIKSGGFYQTENAGIALTVMGVLGLTNVSMNGTGLLNTRWPGRMQELCTGVYLDGAHNEEGVVRFLESVALDGSDKERILLFSAVQDKHYRDMISKICQSNLFQKYILVPIDDPRGEKVAVLEAVFSEHTHRTTVPCDSLTEGVKRAFLEKGAEGILYIAGSLYLAGEVLQKEFTEK